MMSEREAGRGEESQNDDKAGGWAIALCVSDLLVSKAELKSYSSRRCKLAINEGD